MHLPKTSSLIQILHWNLLVWFPLVVSEECLANGRELIDVDRIVPEKETIKSATEFDFEITIFFICSNSNSLIFVECCKARLHL